MVFYVITNLHIFTFNDDSSPASEIVDVDEEIGGCKSRNLFNKQGTIE